MDKTDDMKRDILRRIYDIENGTVKSKNCMACGKYVSEADENIAFVCLDCSKDIEN
jgi:hypothetical protein